MQIRWAWLTSVAIFAAGLVHGETLAELTAQVRQTEIAFARTMADRDLKAFGSFVAQDAVFVNGTKALRGPVAISAGWKSLYEGSTAPFSWAPETVEVLDSGTLALSTGPVLDADGKRVGTFNSVWRRESNGSWKIVLDKGCPACNCAAGK